MSKSIKVKGFLKDVGGASRVTAARHEVIANASDVPQPKDFVRELADQLHPAKMAFRVIAIKDTSPTSKLFRLASVDGHIPVFQAGQYINFRLKIGDSLLTRPYTISSAPYEARGKDGFVEVTIRRNRPYLVPDYFFEHVKVGDVLDANMPFGFFYWEPLRDSLFSTTSIHHFGFKRVNGRLTRVKLDGLVECGTAEAIGIEVNRVQKVLDAFHIRTGHDELRDEQTQEPEEFLPVCDFIVHDGCHT